MAQVTHVWRVIQAWRDETRFPPNQSVIAKALGVTRSAVTDWKYGYVTPKPDNVEALVRMMEPQLGPEVRTRMLDALLRDMGYLPSDLTEAADRAADEILGSVGSPPPPVDVDAPEDEGQAEG